MRSIINEEEWRERRGPKDAYGVPVNRALTKDESSTMNDDISKANAMNNLRTIVGSYGVAQYLAIPALLILSLLGLFKRDKLSLVVSLAAITCCMVCGTFMIYRGYYTSLGW
jgi:hypothetical protein